MSEESTILDLKKDCESRSDHAYKKHVLEPTFDERFWRCSYCGQTITWPWMVHQGYAWSAYIMLGNLIVDLLRACGPLRKRELSDLSGISVRELNEVLGDHVLYPIRGTIYGAVREGAEWRLQSNIPEMFRVRPV